MGDVFEQILEDTQPRDQVATVCVDGRLFSRLHELEVQILQQRQADTDDMSGSEAARELDELLNRAERCTYKFRFVAIGQDRWKRLKTNHAPTKRQAQDYRERGQAPPEFMPTFWPEAIVASLNAVRKAVDDDESWQPVQWDTDKLGEVTKKWNDAQFRELTAACRLANEEGNTLPSSDSAYVRTLTSGGSFGRREQSDGPDLSSMGGG